MRLVLFIDEFDYFVHTQEIRGGGLFASLRSLASGSHRALAVVVASRVPLRQLDRMTRDVGSLYFNHFTEILLGPLSGAEIDNILDAAGDRFSPEDRLFLQTLSGGYPYLVQAAATALFSAEGPEPAQRRRVAGLALLREASPTFNDIWRTWPTTTRYVFAAVAVEHLGGHGRSHRLVCLPSGPSQTRKRFRRSSTRWNDKASWPGVLIPRAATSFARSCF